MSSEFDFLGRESNQALKADITAELEDDSVNPDLAFSYAVEEVLQSQKRTSGKVNPVDLLPTPGAIPHVSPKVDKKSRLEDGDLCIPGDAEESAIIRNSQYNPYIPTEASFDPRLAFEVALAYEPLDAILERHNISTAEWDLLSLQPSFKKAVVKYKDEITEEGIGFRLKAKVQAEAYLKDAHIMIKHPLTPPNVKADMIKWMAKMADLEPRKNEETQGTTFNLQINL